MTSVYQIPPELSGQRLDAALAKLLPEHSRARIQQWIRDGLVELDGRQVVPRTQVSGGQTATVKAPALPVGPHLPRAQALPVDVIHADAALLVVNKPAGMVVHPGAGNPDGTLQNALLHHDPGLAAVPRAGIVHRLDKETSGLLMVARTPAAHTYLVGQLARRQISREYLALVTGRVIAGATIDRPIARDPRDRKRFTAASGGGRHAVTHYRVAERFGHFTLLRVTLETGRTHQIRVHLTHAGWPIVGDPVYRGKRGLPAGLPRELREAITGFSRQALHAQCLGLVHPTHGEVCRYQAPLPKDLAQLLHRLREHDPA